MGVNIVDKRDSVSKNMEKLTAKAKDHPETKNQGGVGHISLLLDLPHKHPEYEANEYIGEEMDESAFLDSFA